MNTVLNLVIVVVIVGWHILLGLGILGLCISAVTFGQKAADWTWKK